MRVSLRVFPCLSCVCLLLGSCLIFFPSYPLGECDSENADTARAFMQEFKRDGVRGSDYAKRLRQRLPARTEGYPPHLHFFSCRPISCLPILPSFLPSFPSSALLFLFIVVVAGFGGVVLCAAVQCDASCSWIVLGNRVVGVVLAVLPQPILLLFKLRLLQ